MGTRRPEVVDEQLAARQGSFRQLDQAGVVSEEEHLRASGEIAEDGEGGTGAIVVEVNEQIVEDNG